VGIDAAAAGTVLGKDVGQLMAKRALDFGGGNLDELGIENDGAVSPVGYACRSAEGGIPIDTGLELATAGSLEKLVGKVLEQGIVAKAGVSPGLLQIVRRGTNTAHDRATKIQEQLPVFHAARAG
jgi:hypothetical protein